MPASFRHGVASGDPTPHRVVLWTRVTPTEAAQPGSGKGPRVRVRWEVARDARFTRVVASGVQVTGPARDHTVKVDAGGLRPDTAYWYRFSFDRHRSPVGRTRTAPAYDADNGRLRFGVASCANWQAGWFSSYRHLADRDDLDFVLHLGDYVYEYGPGEYGMGIDNVDVRRHDPPHEMVTLADYRRRHAQYKTDPDLRRLHARHPFVLTWDDHETADNAWKDGAVNHSPGTEGAYAKRRAAAHKAYDEWMPVRLQGTTAIGDGERIYRRLTFGRLAQLSLLDLRSYRDEQVSLPVDSPALDDPGRTITGRGQMAWLTSTLDDQHSLWRLVGNPVMIAPVRAPSLYSGLLEKLNQATNGTVPLPTDGPPYNTDQWDGYTADRAELYQHLRDQGINNAVFLTGDIHSSWACDLPVDALAYRLTGASVGTEFVCSSVTSNNLKDITGTPPRTSSLAVEAAVTTANPHVKFLNFDDHGYAVVDITRTRLQMDYFRISARDDRKATATRMASWATTVNSNQVHAVPRGVTG